MMILMIIESFGVMAGACVGGKILDVFFGGTPAAPGAPGAVPGAPGGAPAVGVLTMAGQRILQAVSSAISSGVVGSHCWDWIWKVYQLAGFGGDSVHSVRDIQFVFKGSQYDPSNPYKFLPIDRHVEIKPGDWLYIHNGNQWDRNGNHSVIFIKWLDGARCSAQVAASSFAGKPGRYETRNLCQERVAHLMRPKGA